jgi:hypothetical protein
MMDDNGDIGIRTTSPDNELQVDGDIGATGTGKFDINGDADTVDGFDIQKNGTDGSGIINFKT